MLNGRGDNEILTTMLGSMNLTTNTKTIKFLQRVLCTLECRIIVPPCLLIFEKFSNPPALIPTPPFINFWKNEMIVNIISE